MKTKRINKTTKIKIDKDVKILVIERIKASSNLSIFIGNDNYSKEDLVQSIESENELGREIVEIQLDYLRDMASGAIYSSNG